jgi:hypothetical protein
MEDGVPVILGEKANALVVVDDATGRSKVTVSGGVFLNKRAQTTALYSAGGNTVTLSGGRFLSLTTASDNLSLTAQQKAATLKLWGGRYYVISELLGAVDEKAPILLDGAQVNLSVKNAGIRFVSTVKKISGACSA